MKTHSPGCTCCKPKLFTKGDSWAQLLNITPDFPHWQLIPGFGWSRQHHGHLNFPFWAKIYGGYSLSRLNEEALDSPAREWNSTANHPGRFSTFIEDTFSPAHNTIPHPGDSIGLFKNSDNGHYLIQSISKIADTIYDPIDLQMGFGGEVKARSFQWMALWYDLTVNEWVGENSEGTGGPLHVPITVFPPMEHVGVPVWFDSPWRGVEGWLPYGEDVLLLANPESAPDMGGKTVADFEVSMFAPARALTAEFGAKRTELGGVDFNPTTVGIGDVWERPDGTKIEMAEVYSAVEYQSRELIYEMGAHPGLWVHTGAIKTDEEVLAYRPNQDYAGELTEWIREVEANHGQGVVKIKDGHITDKFLIGGAVSPAILTEDKATMVTLQNLRGRALPEIGIANKIFACTHSTCRHLVYGFKYSASVPVPVVTGSYDETVKDYTDVPYPNNRWIGLGVLNPDYVEPDIITYQRETIGTEDILVPSVFPYTLEAPLVDEIHEVLPFSKHTAALFSCSNDSVLGPVPVYTGIKVYHKRPELTEAELHFGRLPQGFIDEEFPRTVAAQPRGVLVRSHAKGKWYYIARLTEILVLDYDAYYAATEGLTTLRPNPFFVNLFSEVTDPQVLGPGEVEDHNVKFFDEPQNPFLIFDDNMEEVLRYTADTYPMFPLVSDDDPDAVGQYAQGYLLPENAREIRTAWFGRDELHPQWATEAWDGKIYFGTGTSGKDNMGGTFQFSPGENKVRRVYNGVRGKIDLDLEPGPEHFGFNPEKAFPGLAPGSDRPPSEFLPGYLQFRGHNVLAYPRNVYESWTNQKPDTSLDLPGFPPPTVT